ncbi:MAG: hypothetical protein WC307_06795, partial [Candidatus Nanoarchaeia archaeon]
MNLKNRNNAIIKDLRHERDRVDDEQRYVTGSGGGGVTDHSLLSNLSYASSGHTGFLQDTNDVIKDTHIDWGSGAGQVNCADIPIQLLGSPTFNDQCDFNKIQGAVGLVSGGVVSDNGDGTVAVSAGTGFVKSTDSDVGELLSFNFDADASVSCTDNSLNFILIQYNGGSPAITSTVDFSTIDFNTEFVIGYCYRVSTTVHIIQAGNHVPNYATYNCRRLFYRGVERMSGGLISEIGTRNIASNAGVFYLGQCKIDITAKDTSGADTFTYYYRDGIGDWTTVATQTQIDNVYWDDGTGTLNDLTSNRYGVHWVFIDLDSNLHVVYGQGDYTLAQAQNASVPSSYPDFLVKFAILAAKIIIQKNAATFTEIDSAFSTVFTVSSVANHNDLSSLQGGTTNEYYHLTSAEYTGTGTGNFVRASTPTLVTPIIGVATATSVTIGANTLDTNEWAYLDGLNQALKTTDSPSFASLTLTDNSATITHTGTTSLTLVSNDGVVIVEGVTFTGGALTGITSLTVDNLVINGNDISSSSGDITLTPTAGSQVIIDGHWEFDANTLTAVSDTNTT